MVWWRIVGPSRGLGRRPSLECCAEEKSLELVEFALEQDNVEGFVLRPEGVFGLFRDAGMFKDSSVRCRGGIVASSDFASDTDFLLEFHDGQKEVAVDPQPGVECAQKVQLLGCIVPIVADSAAYE